jgi:LmbE family N-acetylglucosaminyl deacetylase
MNLKRFFISIILVMIMTAVPVVSFAASDDPAPEDWLPECEKADVLVFATHPDDEVLFLGAAIADLADRGYSVEVVHMMNYSKSHPVREQERQNGIWALGVRNTPVAGRFDASYPDGLMLFDGTIVDNTALTEYCAEMIRRFKPLVVITQDFNGEYGHIRHKLLAAAVAEAVDNSGDPDFFPASADEYGAWQPLKSYFHLYDKGRITLDLRRPLESRDGLTAVEVAAAAYLKHESQQWCWFYVSDDPEDPKAAQINCAEFGLYQTQVGPDTEGVNDMMEHVTSYEEQERIAAEAERARQEAAEKSRREREELHEENARREAEWQVEMTEAARQKKIAANRKKLIAFSSAALLAAALALLFNNKKRS